MSTQDYVSKPWIRLNIESGMRLCASALVCSKAARCALQGEEQATIPFGPNRYGAIRPPWGTLQAHKSPIRMLGLGEAAQIASNPMCICEPLRNTE